MRTPQKNSLKSGNFQIKPKCGSNPGFVNNVQPNHIDLHQAGAFHFHHQNAIKKRSSEILSCWHCPEFVPPGDKKHIQISSIHLLEPFGGKKTHPKVNIIHYEMRFKDYLRLIKNETSLEDFRSKARGRVQKNGSHETDGTDGT